MTIINGGTLPYIYVHMLKAFTMLFVYSTPFLYVNGEYSLWKFLSVVVLAIGYYGIHEVSHRLVDPFGWNRSDIDLETTGIAIDKTGRMLTEGGATAAAR